MQCKIYNEIGEFLCCGETKKVAEDILRDSFLESVNWMVIWDEQEENNQVLRGHAYPVGAIG